MTEHSSSLRERRGLAAAFALCAVATLTLLASHPSSGARGLADVIRDESSHQLIDAVVHGGFVVTLGALIVCFIFLSRLLGSQNVRVVTALVAFCIGSGALMASMILDGLAIPAIAVRLSDTANPDNLAAARPIFILCGTLIRLLMPIGLLFQSAAMLSWSLIIMRQRGLRRAVGIFGGVAALSLIVALSIGPAKIEVHVLLGGILLQAVWYLGLSAMLFRSSSTS
jgi:hypothetical protein